MPSSNESRSSRPRTPKLKRLYAELALENAPSRTSSSEGGDADRARRGVSESLVTEHRLPMRGACRAVGLSRSAWYRRPADPAVRNAAVMTALLAVVKTRARWGFWKCFAIGFGSEAAGADAAPAAAPGPDGTNAKHSRGA